MGIAFQSVGSVSEEKVACARRGSFKSNQSNKDLFSQTYLKNLSDQIKKLPFIGFNLVLRILLILQFWKLIVSERTELEQTLSQTH